MNGFQNRKAQDLQKPFPGCMGRMINIFDLSTGTAGTKLLTGKAHRDGSPLCINRPEAVKKARDNFEVQLDDKSIAPSLRKGSRKKSCGTPMKMLIAQEMLRETESKQKPPNVVARLMGLDALPVQNSAPTTKSSSQEGYPQNTLAGELRGHQQRKQREDGYYHKQLQCEAQSCTHENEYKDVYEVRQQPSRNSPVKDQKGRFNENPTKKRMALVHQKFIEAKRLATDEKLLQSKEFHDALEVLSSNRDLFLKFLEEPSSLFSKHRHELQAASPMSQTKRITVLKPSKIIDATGERQVKKKIYPAIDDNNQQRSSSLTNPKDEYISQPTRIVVLKPSPRLVDSPSPQVMEATEFHGDLGTDEAIGSREVAKEITRQMQECLSSNQRDESLLSSALSNGYVGDESSFNRSENDNIEEECGNFSDSEIVTPTSRHSWDCINRFSSPYSISSFSRASYSPESSVIKEAKKRLSERWAMVASHGISQDRTQVHSSTLGEMLAIPEVKKEEGSDDLTISSSGSCSEQEPSVSACFAISGTKDRCNGGNSPGNLSRSKSVPVSSSVYDKIGLNEEDPESLINKSIVHKGVVESKHGKSSFKGKVSSLFFSRIKKSGREKSIPSPSVSSGKRIDGLSNSLHDHHSMINNSKSEDNSGKTSSPPASWNDGKKQGTFPVKGSISLDKPRTFESSRESQDQPSPISVLEAPFDDDANNNIPRSSASAIGGHPQALSRSAPIESIARTLSWDDNHSEASLPSSLKLSRVLSKECEEQEQLAFVQELLLSANLHNGNSSTVLARWHSPDSPLDPLLLDEFLDRKEEAKCRERRSNQRLLFDCVNTALLEIGRATIMDSYPWSRAHDRERKKVRVCTPVTEEVGKLVRVWLSGEGNWVSCDADNRYQAVDGVVKREVVGSGWVESMWFEIHDFSREIGGKMLEELVEEAIADLIGLKFQFTPRASSTRNMVHPTWNTGAGELPYVILAGT